MRLVLCGGFIGFALAAGVMDFRTRKIPNWLTLAGAAVALAVSASFGSGRLLQSAGGLVVALLVGFACFAIGALGAGDAKLFAAFGAWFGLSALPGAFLAMTAGGAVVALVWVARRRLLGGTLLSTGAMMAEVLQGRKPAPVIGVTEAGRFPYGVGMSLGASAWWLWLGCGL